jgi:hypothetical protein
MREFTASDRSALIRLASTMPKGDAIRVSIVSGLIHLAEDAGSADGKGKGKGPGPEFLEYFDEVWEGGKKKVKNPNPKTKDKYPDVTVGTAVKDKNSPIYKQVIDGFKRWLEDKKKKNKKPGGRLLDKHIEKVKAEKAEKDKAEKAKAEKAKKPSNVLGDAHVSDNSELDATATVQDEAYVGFSSKVKGKAKVTETAQIRYTEVKDNAIVGGNADVHRCDVSGNAKISGRDTQLRESKISGNAKVTGEVYSYNADISGDAKVSGKAKIQDAKISGKARISGTAVILGGEWDGSEGPITEGVWTAPGVRADIKDEELENKINNKIKKREKKLKDSTEVNKTSSERSALIKLAASLPVGSTERRVILNRFLTI